MGRADAGTAGVAAGRNGEGLALVYVDDMRARFGRLVLCHMPADTDDELHAMADTIGVARRWHQGDRYDIALSKRALAVAAGAVEVTLRQMAAMSMRRRVEGALGAPGDALARARERLERQAPPPGGSLAEPRRNRP